MLTELNETELQQIEGGHEGLAYQFGQAVGEVAHAAWIIIRMI